MHNSSFPYLYLWHIDCIAPTLSFVIGILLLPESFLLPPLEWALLVLIIAAPPVAWAILGARAAAALKPPYWFLQLALLIP